MNQYIARLTQSAFGVVVLVLAQLASANAEGPIAYRVLTVGINQYKHKSVPDLRGAVNDSKQVAAFFRDQGAVDVHTLFDEQATIANVSREIERMRNEVKKGDHVAIFLSGHGSREGGHFEFVCYDSVPGGSKNEYDRISTSLELLLDVLVNRGAHALVMIDACHAGQLADRYFGSDPRNFSASPPRAGSLILMASCVPSQLSIDSSTNGLFTKALLEALRGDADVDTDAVVTVKEVRGYLFWRMRELVKINARNPAMEWPEQDELTLWTPNISETLVLSRTPGAKPRRPGTEKSGPFPKNLDWPGKTASETGIWVMSEPIRKADGTSVNDKEGKPRRAIYALEFRPGHRYVATFLNGFGEERTNSGKYSFGMSGGAGLKNTTDIRMVFGNGHSFLDIVKLDNNEFTFWVKNPGGEPRKFTLVRLQVNKSPVP